MTGLEEKKKRVLFFAFLISFLLFPVSSIRPSDSKNLYIILGSGVANLTVEDIKKAYKGELSSMGGKEIILYEPPVGSDAKKIFVQEFLGMDMETYRKIWLIKLMGGSQVPKVVKEDEIVNHVATQSNAVGYVSFHPPADRNVKVITIK